MICSLPQESFRPNIRTSEFFFIDAIPVFFKKKKIRYVFVLAMATFGGHSDDSGFDALVKAITMASGIAKKNLFGSELDRYFPLLHHYIAMYPVDTRN